MDPVIYCFSDLDTNQITNIHFLVIFDNITARYRDRKSGIQNVFVGSDIYLDSSAKPNARHPFDGNIVVNTDYMEHIMDHIFTKMGIDTDRVLHPILMTEPLCNPDHSRKIVSELLFECYQVPSVCYTIDALCSYYANNHGELKDGLIVSIGHSAIHIIPVVNGHHVPAHSKRINYGGHQAADHLLKLMQLKYPSFPVKMTYLQAQHLFQQHTYVAVDYIQELRDIEKACKSGDESSFLSKTHVIQFPFIKPDFTEEDRLAAAERKRKENADRLRAQTAKQRAEKLVEKQSLLEQLHALKEFKTSAPSLDDYLYELKENGFETEADFELAINGTDYVIRKIQAKMNGEEFTEEDPYVIAAQALKAAPNFDLVDIPDAALTPEQIKEKRKQRLLKANYDARERMRKEKELAKQKEEEARRVEEEQKANDFAGWLSKVYAKRDKIVDKIRARRKKRAALADRRSQASQERMKAIAGLASDADGNTSKGTMNDGATGGSSGAGASSTGGAGLGFGASKSAVPKRRRRKQHDDGFGADDEDWMIYRQINTGEGHEDTDDEESDMTQLEELNALLLSNDPNFDATSTETLLSDSKPFSKTIISQLTYGPNGYTGADDLSKQYQLCLNVERARVPEVFFQPSMVGMDQAGIIEVMEEVLNRFEEPLRSRMAENVFITGTPASLPNFRERIYNEIRANRPVDTEVNVRVARDLSLDAWKGASMWAQKAWKDGQVLGTQGKQGYGFMSKRVWEECGHEYLVESVLGNSVWKGGK